MTRGFLAALCLTLTPGQTHAADYHLDARGGSNTRTGLSPNEAWQSLEKVNATVFQPGDRLLFKAGESWTGQLKVRGSGRMHNGKPALITAGKFGEGPLPRIDGAGMFPDAVLIENVEFWRIEDLEITNLGPQREPWRTGVRILANGIGKMRHIHLRRLHVHDVNGDLRKEHEGSGIYFESRGDTSHFDGLAIEDCHVERSDRNGICQRGGRSRSVKVIIRRNRLDDIGGDAIKLWGTNGGLIEYNIVRGARMRCVDHAAGIWPFACDDTLIQFNEVSGTKGIKDGQGFDADYLCRRSVFQYNYSHHNEGGFILICGPGKSWNESPVVRYNFSVHDGINTARVFHFGGKSTNALIHNNTVVIGPGQDLPMIQQTQWNGGFSENARFANNLFIVEPGGRATYGFTHGVGNVFENNLFVGRHEGLPARIDITGDPPPLAGRLQAGDGRDSLAGFRPKSGSGFPIGKIINSAAHRDFFGVPIPANTPPRIGAAEIPPR